MSELIVKFTLSRISHTDQDMLTITFKLNFLNLLHLKKDLLYEELFVTLELLAKL